MSFEFVSYFGFRASNFLFSFLGVLCPVEYRLDQDRVVRPKRYSTGLALWNIDLNAAEYDPQGFTPRGKGRQERRTKNSKHEIRNTKQIQIT